MIDLIKIDDFAPDILEVRQKVIESEFTTETGPDGHPYTGICKLQVPEWEDRLRQYLGRQIDIKTSLFRVNYKGELPHSWVHSDTMCSKYATVLYMNLPEQCQGGTAFWRHRALKVDKLYEKEELESQGIDVDWYYGMMTREWKDLTYWEQHCFVGMKFNRLITYQCSMFHSRYPFEGFGTTPEDGRLVWVNFYD